MDLLQLVFGFVNAPLFATFLLGMFWKRTTGHGAFFGLAERARLAAAADARTDGGRGQGRLDRRACTEFPSTMAQNFWIAIFAWTTCFVVTIVVSLMTRPKTGLGTQDLVYGLTEMPSEEGVVWYKRPGPLAIVVAVICIALNFLFW